MTSRDFCFWLQGFLELRDPKGNGDVCGPMGLSPDQVECVKRHLGLVFKHELDPSMGGPSHQQLLDAVHFPPSGPGGPTMRC